MTFNVGLFIAIIVGAFFGYLVTSLVKKKFVVDIKASNFNAHH